ncbi:MAG: YceI family protein [Acetobacteraceae bacterium]
MVKPVVVSRLFAAAVAVSLTATGAPAATRHIRLGPATGELTFRAYGLGLLPIDARFTRFDGNLTYDPADPTSCRVDLVAQVDSIVTEDPDRRATIIGPDFMDSGHYPTLTFSGACGTDGLDGMLGMHGVTRPFTLSLEWRRDAVEAEGRLLRAEWGMTAMPLLAGRTVRIRVTVPLTGNGAN